MKVHRHPDKNSTVAKNALLLMCFMILIAAAKPSSAMPILWSEAAGGNGHFYEFTEAPQATWDEARTAAESSMLNGFLGHLATITSESENAFITSLLPMIPPDETSGVGEPEHVHLGGIQLDTSGANDAGWAWITGEVWHYTNWSPIEPNNQRGLEDFLGIWAANDDSHLRGEWNDGGGGAGGDQIGYLVEWDTPVNIVPEPGSLSLLFFGSGALVVGAAVRKRGSAS
ncbi:MAG: PEP-CTERM sorting domain-containing protein [Deltaproteobacteria bacterium]|nr:PEP-CTERM sorting domain-containing protein [Deltaproteobacteria bacterium]